MKIAVLKEAVPWECRVPIVPDSIKRLGQKKIEVLVERGAGERALASDADYEGAGAKVLGTADEVIAQADCIMRLNVPSVSEVAALREGSTLIAPILPLVNHELVRALAARKITTLALDAIPRTTVAQ